MKNKYLIAYFSKTQNTEKIAKELGNLLDADFHEIKEKVEEALGLVRLKEFANRSIAEMSGGQKQRLTIARALLSPAKVIILDESTSGLDIITEEKLVKNLINLTSKTIIFIAHRLSIAKITNNITVIDNGAIVEQGSHNQLLKEHGLYFNLLQKY